VVLAYFYHHHPVALKDWVLRRRHFCWVWLW
jgi:hypothetical protein